MALPFQFETKSIIEEGRTTQEAVDTIRQWLHVTTLPSIQEEFIVLFLLSNSNDIDGTKKTIEAYFRIKNKAPRIFNDCDMKSKELENVSKVLGVCVISARMPNNVAVICYQLKDPDYRNFDFIACMKWTCMSIHFCQIANPPDELVMVFDLKELRFMHLTCLKIGAGISYLEYLQEAVPIKIKNIHILNSSYVFDRILQTFKLFIKDKLMASIQTHSPEMKMEEFHQKWVPADYLPHEFGGNLSSFDGMSYETIRKLEEAQPFFDAEERLRKSYKI